MKNGSLEWQISLFDEEPLSWFEENLQRGSGFADGKIRLYIASFAMDDAEFAEYCKREYGIGGWSIDGGFLDHNSKGIVLRIWKTDYVEMYNWTYVAKGIKKLISIDKYLTDKEKEKIEQIKERNGGVLPMPTELRYIGDDEDDD